jgi:hypothetical protein
VSVEKKKKKIGVKFSKKGLFSGSVGGQGTFYLQQNPNFLFLEWDYGSLDYLTSFTLPALMVCGPINLSLFLLEDGNCLDSGQVF